MTVFRVLPLRRCIVYSFDIVVDIDSCGTCDSTLFAGLWYVVGREACGEDDGPLELECRAWRREETEGASEECNCREPGDSRAPGCMGSGGDIDILTSSRLALADIECDREPGLPEAGERGDMLRAGECCSSGLTQKRAVCAASVLLINYSGVSAHPVSISPLFSPINTALFTSHPSPSLLSLFLCSPLSLDYCLSFSLLLSSISFGPPSRIAPLPISPPLPRIPTARMQPSFLFPAFWPNLNLCVVFFSATALYLFPARLPCLALLVPAADLLLHISLRITTPAQGP